MRRSSVPIDGRTAYVSGAASGIGRATAVRLAQHGCPVAIADQDEAGLAETADLIDGPVLARRLDVRDRQAQELRGSGVDAVTVHPGGIKTNILRNARCHSHPTQPDLTHEEANRQFDAIAFTTPERAAKVIHDGVKRGRSRILVGPDAYAFDALARLAPTHYFDVIAALEPLAGRHGAGAG